MKTIYVANDGKQFDNIDDCKKYEAYGIKTKLALESTVGQLENFRSSKNKVYYYAKISGNLYSDRGKIFYKSKSNLVKSLKSSIKQFSGYWGDDKIVSEIYSEIYDIMMKNNVLSIGVLSV